MMETLLELKDVSKSFSLGRKRHNLALNQINLSVQKGEVLGLVGESGCGKSTLARVVMGVYPPTSGSIYYEDQPLQLRTQSQRRCFANKAQMIFQDPYTSLDPYMTVEAIIGENLEIHGISDREGRKKRICELLEMTGLSKEYAGRFPHEFSGGQRQRIGIARALAVKPEFIICDEPISALDISIRSQIINLLLDLKKELGLTYLFISHDLNIIRHISDRIAVMYAGRIVELGNAHELYTNPLHPYTKMLLKSVLPPVPDKNRLNKETGIEGEVTGMWENGEGCPFSERCPEAAQKCREVRPKLTEVKMYHMTACHNIAYIE